MRVSMAVALRTVAILAAAIGLSGCPDREVPKPPSPPPSGVPKTGAAAPAPPATAAARPASHPA